MLRLITCLLVSLASTTSASASDPPAVEVGMPFPHLEDVEFHGCASPFDATPSGRYTVVVFYTFCEDPSATDGAALNALAARFVPAGVDIVAFTVLGGSKSVTRIRSAKLETPWAEIPPLQATACGFPVHVRDNAVIVEPSGRVAWIGPEGAIAETLEALERKPTLPAEEGWPDSRAARKVSDLVEKGRLGRALEAARAAEEPALARIAAALATLVEDRIALARHCLEEAPLETAEAVVEQLARQLDGSEREGEAEALRKVWREVERERG